LRARQSWRRATIVNDVLTKISPLVMAGLVLAIHVFTARAKKDVDARDKRGHDGRKGS
jgi:hypothetical protein